LHISEYVVYETGESRGSLGTDDADTADERAVHGALDEAEDVLHTASGLGLLAVALLLLVCQRMVTMAFLTDDRSHSALPDHIVLRLVACIKIQLLAGSITDVQTTDLGDGDGFTIDDTPAGDGFWGR